MERIAAAAKKEGSVTFYTTIAEKDLPVVLKPFEQRYGVKVNVWRAGTDKVLQRAIQEARAGRNDMDAVHFGSPEMEALAREKVLAPVASPVHKDLIGGSRPGPPKGGAAIPFGWGPGHNNRPVEKTDTPKK